MNVRTRMAPSPTGNLHLGTAYATLWPYLFAKKNQGKFILRIEDTDRERSTKEFEENITQGLEWLGYFWDEGPFHQMDRLDLYMQKTNQLLEEGKAYYCFCTKEELDEERMRQTESRLPQIYSGKCRSLIKEEAEQKKNNGASYVIRHKLPEDRGVIEYEDLIHGKISFDSKLIGDTVIMRQNGIPLYNHAVVIDDIEMGITHVIRGDDHISNTPKQILLWEAFGYSLPEFAHYPVLLNQDRSGKLSKRTGSTSVEEYKHMGYLPEALINYLALLGWTPPNDQEILSLGETVASFDIKDMNKAAAAWNEQKLDWINGEYIRKMSDEELAKRLEEYLVDHPSKEKIAPLVPLIKERIKKLSDFIPLTNFILESPEYDVEVFEKLKIEDPKAVSEKVLEKLTGMERPWKPEEFEQTFRKLAGELNISASDMFQLIRVLVSGQLVSPPLFESIQILGDEETLNRVKYVIETYPNFPFQKPEADRF
jgi:glutamyl-tRNA synthetase